MNFSVHKVLLEHSNAHLFHIVYVHTARGEYL